jgi:glycosyltransferase involved in cell wall biosynthesis
MLDRKSVVKNRLTIVQILPALDAGGVERGTLEIAAALVAAGHRSVVVSTGGRLVEELEKSGSEHIVMPVAAKRPWTLLGTKRLRRVLETLAADIIHARSRVPAWLAYLAWRRMPNSTRPRFVTTVHGFYSVNRYSAVMTRGERVIAVSNSIRTYIAEQYAVDMAKVVTIYRGIDRTAHPFGFVPAKSWLREWRQPDGAVNIAGLHTPMRAGEQQRVTQTLGFDVRVPLITLAGRLTRLKGHETFIDLLTELKRRGIAAHGLIVGAEDAKRRPYAQALYERACDVPITFLGHRQDLREIMTQSRLVLSLSTQPESFGRTVLEALSLGRPVIGFDHGGVGEILGALYPQGRISVASNLDALADKVSSFIAEAPTVPDHSQFALRTMQSNTLKLYEELAQGRAP